MTRQTEAEEFISKIKRMFARQDGLIYEFNSYVSDPNLISLDTIGKKDVTIEVVLYNAPTGADGLTHHDWMALGEMDGVDADTYSGRFPSIEIFNRL